MLCLIAMGDRLKRSGLIFEKKNSILPKCQSFEAYPEMKRFLPHSCSMLHVLARILIH